MPSGCPWVDLLDPTEEELRRNWPGELHPKALEVLLRPAQHGDQPRPKVESQGSYALFVLLTTRTRPGHDDVYHQEIDLLLTGDRVLSVRKTPEHGEPFPIDDTLAVCHKMGHAPGMVAYLIVDDVAESYLDLIEDLNSEIDDLQDTVDDADPVDVRNRISNLRHGLIHIRQTLAPTRDGVRRVVDNRVELDDEEELFPREIEVHFADAFDKLLRATEGLQSASDLLAGVRDYLQSKIANDQNAVTTRLTMVASLLLVPTFIVGLYGQNFRHIPELGWSQGYAFSWALIVGTTLLQLWYFRRKKWL